MADETVAVGLGAQVQIPTPPDHATAQAQAAENRTQARAALAEAQASVLAIEGGLVAVAGDDALAGAHCTLRTVASMLGAELSALGG